MRGWDILDFARRAATGSPLRTLLMTLAMAAAAPDRAEAVRRIGVALGDSAAVCAVNRPADVEAGRALGERLAGDAEIRGWINGELQAAAPRLIERYRDDIRHYIVARVQAWDSREMTDELERHIGRDLQFIRINGTLVGGLIGLLIHTVTEALKHAV